MKKAVLSGALVALGMLLAIWATFQEVRLDWPETALVAGISCFISGCTLFWEIMNSIREE